jgi:hypothetical protein
MVGVLCTERWDGEAHCEAFRLHYTPPCDHCLLGRRLFWFWASREGRGETLARARGMYVARGLSVVLGG